MKKDLAKEIYDDGYVTGYKYAVKKFLKDLNDFNWRYDIEDAGVGDWTKMIEKWEGELKK